MTSASIGYTPGPWRADGFVIKSVDQFVASAELMRREPFSAATKESHANARLIAAAPNLLEALKDCVHRLRRCAELHGNAPFAVDALCEQFESVIAKAEQVSV
jgi:hypothetical protein